MSGLPYNLADNGKPMKTNILTVLFAAALGLSVPATVFAAPTVNNDGSKTCTASGPSGTSDDGICANDLATNESFCDGGMSSEPGGGTTCSPPPASSARKPGQKIKN
jgi:hypothetical protein